MVLAAKSLMGLLAIALAIPISAWAQRSSISKRQYDVAILSAMVGSRIGLFLVIFVVFKINPQSDVTVYYDEGRAALNGAVPLVSIQTAYGPLFDYIVAAIILVWNSTAALVLVAVVVEICSLPIWMRLARSAFTEAETRVASALYVLNPLAISTVVIAGQNHVGLSLLLAASLIALMRDRNVLSGMWLGLSAILISFFSLLFAPILFLKSSQRTAWILSFLMFPIAGYGFVMALGANPLKQVAFHAYDTSSGNLPYLLSAIGLTLVVPWERLTADVIAFGVLCSSFIGAVFRLRGLRFSQAVLMCAFILLVTMIVSKKAFSTYLIIALFPMCLAIAGQARLRWSVTFFQLLMALAAIEPSLWFRWLRERELTLILERVRQAGVTTAHLLLFLGCEIFLVCGYAAMLWIVWRAMTEPHRVNRGNPLQVNRSPGPKWRR